MSHDHGGRASCLKLKLIPPLHFDSLSVARGVTDVVVGSGALLGSGAFHWIMEIEVRLLEQASYRRPLGGENLRAKSA
jgi:hypothetical protein